MDIQRAISPILRLSRFAASLSLHSEFLVHSPYKGAFVRYMNATIRQNEINNTAQARTETNVSRSLAKVFPLWDAFMFIITTMSFVHGNPI